VEEVKQVAGILAATVPALAEHPRTESILAKLDPPRPATAPYPPVQTWVNSSIGRRKRRRKEQ